MTEYVGIDWAYRRAAWCAMSAGGVISAEGFTPADEDGLAKLVLRLGSEVKACLEMMSGVGVELDRGDVGTAVLEGEGILEHSSVPIDTRTQAVQRDDVAGWYRVGGTRVNLTELEQVKGDEDELVILLAEGVRLRIIEQAELPE
jgi:hypothetical protein